MKKMMMTKKKRRWIVWYATRLSRCSTWSWEDEDEIVAAVENSQEDYFLCWY